MKTTNKESTANKNFSDILEIRNLIALIITLAFTYLAVIGDMDNEDVLVVVMLVMGFFFGNKATKDQIEKEGNSQPNKEGETNDKE